MTMTTEETVTTVQKFARQFQAVIDLSDHLDSVNKIKQLGDEAQARLDNIQSEEKAAAERIAAANKKLEDAMARAVVSAKQIEEDAKKEAERRKLQAENEAHALIEQATRMAGDMTQKAQNDIAPLVDKAESARSEWKDMEQKLINGRKELSDLKQKIDQARETIAQLMKV